MSISYTYSLTEKGMNELVGESNVLSPHRRRILGFIYDSIPAANTTEVYRFMDPEYDEKLKYKIPLILRYLVNQGYIRATLDKVDLAKDESISTFDIRAIIEDAKESERLNDYFR